MTLIDSELLETFMFLCLFGSKLCLYQYRAIAGRLSRIYVLGAAGAGGAGRGGAAWRPGTRPDINNDV